VRPQGFIYGMNKWFNVLLLIEARQNYEAPHLMFPSAFLIDSGAKEKSFKQPSDSEAEIIFLLF
jgi:hypothetical protein